LDFDFSIQHIIMKKTLILLLALATAFSVQAQKFGYCNSLALLSEMPEVKAADSELQAYQTQLTKKGQEMVAALQDKAKVLEQKNAEGGIAPKDYEAQMLKLQEEEKEIAKYEQEVYQKLGEKRETLYKPVLDKLNEAMKLVAKEQGMNMVFDTGSQVLLYADESLDVTPLVKVKMGIK